METFPASPVGQPRTDRPTLLLIDGSGYIFRAYHAVPHLSTRHGEATNAVYGFTTMLLKALREAQPSHLAMVFDLNGSVHRTGIDPNYKANRTAPPDDLVPQFGRVREVVRALNVPMLELSGIEADDIIATLARRGRAEGFQVVILTGDKDFMQIVDEEVSLYDSMRDRWTRPKEVEERLGLGPAQVVEYMALLGDAIDNVPGVPGVGPKTASQLIQSFGNIDSLFDRLHEVPKEKLRSLLAQYEGSIRRARRLVELQSDLPLEVGLGDLVRRPPNEAEVRRLFEELEFTRLVRESFAPTAAEAPVPAAEPAAFRFTPPQIVFAEEAVDAALRVLSRAPSLALQLELGDAGENPQQPVGLALAGGEPRQVFYFPLAHAGLEGRLAPAAFQSLRRFLETATPGKVGYGLKRAWTGLRSLGIELRGLRFDGELAAYLIDPGRDHALADQVLQKLRTALPPIEPLQISRRKVSLAEMVPALVAPRAGAAAEAALELQRQLTPELSQLGVDRLLEDLEMPLLLVLAEMEWQGVQLDLERLGQLSQDVDRQLASLTDRIYEMAGFEFNIASNRQLAEVLFKNLKLPVLRRTKTGPSTDQEVLEKLAQQHPLPASVLEVRQLAKLKGTYLDALPRLIDPRDGRLHTTFNQATAATGRLSSSDPNLQNIPTRTDLGRRIREAFVAAPGNLLVAADYNQIELRILAHMSQDEALKSAFAQGLDIHTETAAEVFGVPASQLVPEMRRVAKAINFGIAYGLSAFGLAQRLELPSSEAQSIIDRYFARFHGVRRWLDATIVQARNESAVSTLFGRRRQLPDIHSRNAAVRQASERMAVNTPIQGTAADLIKRAMLQVDALLRERHLAGRMTLQVHDELVFEVPATEAEAVAAVAREAMIGAAQLSVPLEVTVGIDCNWAEAH